MSRVDQWTRPSVLAMKPYYKAPLEGNPLRLDQNTNLHGRNPALDKVAMPDMDQYPTRDADDLLDVLASVHGLAPDNFVVGNGSDEILDLLTKAFTAPGQKVVSPAPSYSLYPFYAALQDVAFASVPLDARYQLDAAAVIAAKPNLVLLASPNNPTGNAFDPTAIEEILAGVDGVVVVDEAYIEYGGTSWMSRINQFDNLLVMRTLSKAHGLAGLRVGYIAGNVALIDKLRLVKPPFNLNRASEAVACAALQDLAWMQGHVADVRAERERLADGLKARGFKVHPSDANFLLTEHAMVPGDMAAALQARGILARTFAGKPGLENKIRFGVGLPRHTDRLFVALDEVLQ